MNVPVILSIFISLALVTVPRLATHESPTAQPPAASPSQPAATAVATPALDAPIALARTTKLSITRPSTPLETQKAAVSPTPSQSPTATAPAVSSTNAPAPPTPTPANSPTASSCPNNTANTNWLWLPPECYTAGKHDEVATSGLSGVITIGPSCPVVTMTTSGETSESCADKPYETTMFVYSGDEEVAQFTSDKNGRYSISLAPGTYTVYGTTDLMKMTHVEPKTVTITTGAYATANFAFDNGMR